tara:strand:- start:1211 stop:1567 length:357 start_codon:yes stop_codon:yes gene_type:complete
MKKEKDYMTNKHGVITNPEYEILNFPKSYKFKMYFTVANTVKGLCIGFTYNSPVSGLGSACLLRIGHNPNELDYKVDTINRVISHLNTNVYDGWQKNTGPKVIKKLQEYKDQYLQEAA